MTMKSPNPMRPRLVHLIPAAGFLAVLVISAIALYDTMTGGLKHPPVDSPLLGRDAPTLPELALNQSKEISLSDLRGKPVLINFMASWCLPCRAEIPALDLLHRDVAIIAIAYKDRPEDTAAFLAEYGDPYDGVWMDADGRAGLRWGIYGVPETFVIDADGKIVLRHAGPVLREALDDVIIPALEALE
jgi:cytochrome c biogenesis protein CcmG/thiol:disulfide interchange protein DsbE